MGLLLILTAAGCGPQVTPTPTPLILVVTTTPGAPTAAPVATQTPFVLVVTATPLPPTKTPMPTPTSAVVAATATPIPLAETPLPTPTPAADAVVAVRAANLRGGPGLNYPILAVLREGERLTVKARSSGGNWLQVQTESGLAGWLSIDLVTLNLALSSVPIAKVLPTVPVTQAPPPPSQVGLTPTPPCPRVPIRGFGKVWDENPSARALVGCPYTIEQGTHYQAQRFERGVMLWTSADFYDNTGIVWVLFADNGTYARVPDTWVEGQPEPTPLSPPEGLHEPRGRLGKAWREGAGVRSRLGWAIEPVQQGSGAWQGFDRGYMFWIVYKQGTPDEERWIYVLSTYYPWPPGGQRQDWLQFVDKWEG